MPETDDNVKVVTTYSSHLDGEVEVDPEQYQPPAPPEAETITASTTDNRTAITAEKGVGLNDSSLKDYREASDGNTNVTSYEPPDSSRHRSEASFEDYQRELDRLKFPEDRELLQQISEQGKAPPPQRQSEANMSK